MLFQVICRMKLVLELISLKQKKFSSHYHCSRHWGLGNKQYNFECCQLKKVKQYYKFTRQCGANNHKIESNPRSIKHFFIIRNTLLRLIFSIRRILIFLECDDVSQRESENIFLSEFFCDDIIRNSIAKQIFFSNSFGIRIV